MDVADYLFAVGLYGISYVVAPISLLWGWISWIRGPKQRTVSSMLSLIGFVLASASALLAISAVAYTRLFGGFALNALINAGLLLSLAAIVFGLCGVWQRNLLRWQSPVAALATAMYWALVVMASIP